MKFDHSLCVLLLLVTVTTAARNRKGKDRKAHPQWKHSSMPAKGQEVETVFEGKDLKLDCKASGHPRPSVTWSKDGVKLMDSDNIQMKKWFLSLKSLTTDMAGNYTCKVGNKHGELEWTFHIFVQGEPKKAKAWPLILEGPQNITQLAGTTVSFKCRVLNDPLATITWQRGKEQRKDPSSPEFLRAGDEPGILVLKNISKEDEGEYRCMAGNVNGLKFGPAWLTVIEPVLQTTVPKIPRRDNNPEEPNFIDNYPPYEPNYPFDVNTGGGPHYTEKYNPGGGDPDDYGPDLYFTTTRRPRNRNKNNKRKNKKNKDRNKDKNRFESEPDEEGDYDPFGSEEPTTATKTTTPFPIFITKKMDKIDKTSFPAIWNLSNYEDDHEGVADSRYRPPATSKTEEAKEPENASDRPEGSISSWTIYTIVGAVSGVILLVGLVAITLALCCKKEEGGVYKSTPV